MNRDDAIKILNTIKMLMCRPDGTPISDGYEALDMAIEALQDRPKGEWIKNDDFTCSECGYHMIVGDGAYNFCPNCGARMENK